MGRYSSHSVSEARGATRSRSSRRGLLLALALATFAALGFLLVIAAPQASASLPERFFGMQFPYRESPEETAAAEIETLSHSGAKYFRINLSWKNIEPSEGKFDWSMPDRAFGLAAEKGITIFPDLYGNRLGATCGHRLPGKSTEWQVSGAYLAWEKFITLVVERYGQNGSFWTGKTYAKPATTWEVWNEPNRGENSFNPSPSEYPDAKKYAEFVNRSARTIRAVSGNSTDNVLMGGLLTEKTAQHVSESNCEGTVERANYNVGEFLKKALEEHSVEYNGIGIHPYAFGEVENSEETTAIAEKVEANITFDREQVNLRIGSAEPLWITELGWPVEHGEPSHHSVTPPTQAALLSRVAYWVESEQAADKIESFIFFNYRDYEQEGAFGYSGLRTFLPLTNGPGKELPFEKPTFREAWYNYQELTSAPKWPKTPAAVTEEATNIQKKQATLNGYVNPYGLPTEYHFEWGPTGTYGHSVPSRSENSAGFKEVNGPKSSTIEVEPNTLYHYRIVATNENDETTGGEDHRFTSLPEPPPTTTEEATSIAATSATLNGKINALGRETKYYFEYGLTTSYGTKTLEHTMTGKGEETVSAMVSALSPYHTYHYRLVATNSGGKGEGADKVVKTLPSAPSESLPEAVEVGTYVPLFKGTVNPNGKDTHYYFEYHSGTRLPAEPLDIGSEPNWTAVSQRASELKPNATYEIRLVATNELGTTNSGYVTFKTPHVRWKLDGAFIYTRYPMAWSGTLTVSDEIFGITESVACSNSGKGQVGPGAWSELTTWTLKCSAKENCAEGTAEVGNLPWQTEFAGSIEAPKYVLSEYGKSTARLTLICHVLGVKVTDVCEGTLNGVPKNLVSGHVEVNFNEKFSCSAGSKERGLVTGSMLIEESEGKSLSFAEAT